MSSEASEHVANVSAATSGVPTIEVNDLHIVFGGRQGFLTRSHEANRAVDGVSFTLAEGDVLGIVGESGAGKSALLRALVRVRRPTAGTISFRGKDLWTLDRDELRQYRQSVTLVFQNALQSFPPGMRVGEILAEPLRVNKLGDRRERQQRIEEALVAVGLDPSAVSRLPRQLSGGQRQRVGIARALVLKPKVMILDEPVSALDVSIQAQVLNLFLDLQREYGLTYLIAAHDLAVLKHTCTRIAVMYLGQIVEIGPTDQIFANPLHPYTQSLLQAVPTISRGLSEGLGSSEGVGGDLPDAFDHPSGCKFHPRCRAKAQLPDERFSSERPALVDQGNGHSVACFLYRATHEGNAT